MKELVQITRYSKSEYYDIIRRLDERKRAAILAPQLPLSRMSKLIAESFVADSSEPVPDCRTCGVCCAFPLIVPIRIGDSDHLKEYWDVTLDEAPDEVTIDRVLPRNLETGWCTHLDGTLKEEIACRIYDDRPQLCHDFEAGSDRCHEYRRMYGLEPQLSEVTVAEFMQELNALPKPERISLAATVTASVSYSFSMYDGESSTERKVKIIGFLDDDDTNQHELYVYNPAEETWFESDFLGKTLAEARELIEARTGKIDQ